MIEPIVFKNLTRTPLHLILPKNAPLPPSKLPSTESEIESTDPKLLTFYYQNCKITGIKTMEQQIFVHLMETRFQDKIQHSDPFEQFVKSKYQ